VEKSAGEINRQRFGASVGMSYNDAVRLSALTKDTKQIRRFLRLARTLHNLEHAER